ncbi:MAG: hypothetical protein ACREON_04830, partial [Gemmatimonadaceae bacterium]
MRRGAAIVLALVTVTTASAAAQVPAGPPAPSGECTLIFETTPKGRLSSTRQPSGQSNYFLGGGVVARCPDQSMTLIADSAEYFGDTRILRLITNVHYTEPRLTLTSDLLTYWMAEERFRAEGHVVSTLASGTTLTGPAMDYYRAVPRVRARSRMVAPGRPTIDVAQRDSTGRPAEPIRVLANTVVIDGDSLVYASGRVEITRTDIVARSDTAFMDGGTEFVRLMREPVIEGRGDRSFVLTGNEIDLHSRQRALERAIAKGRGKGVSDDVTLTGDTLDFRFAEGRMQRVFAFGATRARAVSETYDIVSDSLDVDMAGQRMREVRAVREAYAQSVPDTTKVRTTEHDWLRGDTIFAHFDTAAAPVDSSRNPQLSRLVAKGSASSYYQLAPRDTAAVAPAVNYVRGRDITVAFANREVQTVRIVEQATGVYAEPGAAEGAPPAATGSPAAPRAAQP